MQRISSRATFWNKRIFPLIWFGMLAFFVFLVLRDMRRTGGVLVAPFIVLAGMAAFSYFLLKKMVFDLADEVFDAGDSLIVRFGSEQERILLSQIINVSYSYVTNPARVTLSLRTAGRFGMEITFMPPQRYIPFAKSPIVADLIERIDAARRG
jgi:hypothetical protein